MKNILTRLFNHPLALTLLAPIIILQFHAAFYLPFLSDDTLISLRYAERLIDGKGLTWNDGFPVEGYSNLLWVLCNAALGKLGLDLIVACRVLGLACMSGVLVANWYIWRENFTPSKKITFIAAQFLFAMSAPIAVWSIAGLEQPLVAVTLAWAIAFTWKYFDCDTQQIRFLLLASFSLGLLAITRPDGPLFSVGIALSVIIVGGLNTKSIGHCFILSIFPILMYGGQLIFRLNYYQDWVPNTAYAKVNPSFTHSMYGLGYLVAGLVTLAPFSYFIVKYLFSRKKTIGFHSRKIVALCLLAPWFAYLIFIGGDIFPAFRHFIPVLVILALAFPLLDATLFENKSLSLNHYRKLKIYGCIFIALQFLSPTSLIAHQERFEWDGQVLSNLLVTAYGDAQPLIAVTAAGSVPYFTGFPSLDMLGLNDHFLARNPPPNQADGYIGHELGNGAYVFSEAPDLISFCLPKGSLEACFISGKEMQNDPKFSQQYSPVIFRGKQPYLFDAILWVKKESEKVGLRLSDKRIEIPAYLLKNESPTITYLNKANRLASDFSAKDQLEFSTTDLNHTISADSTFKITSYPSDKPFDASVQYRSNGFGLKIVPKSDLNNVEKFILSY